METKLFASELKVMSVLWRDGDVPAKHIAKLLTEELGWNVNTTYTLIKRCIKKGAIERSDPGFMCHALCPHIRHTPCRSVRLFLPPVFLPAAQARDT